MQVLVPHPEQLVQTPAFKNLSLGQLGMQELSDKQTLHPESHPVVAISEVKAVITSCHILKVLMNPLKNDPTVDVAVYSAPNNIVKPELRSLKKSIAKSLLESAAPLMIIAIFVFPSVFTLTCKTIWYQESTVRVAVDVWK